MISLVGFQTVRSTRTKVELVEKNKSKGVDDPITRYHIVDL